MAPPVRTCIGCGKKGQRDRLLRVVPGGDGVISLDPGKHAAGRGAWVHPRVECLEAAEGPRALGRAYRGKAHAPKRGALVQAARELLGSLEEG